MQLSFRKPVLGRRTVQLLGLAPAPLSQEWNLPTLRVPEAASHVGQVLVQAAPSLRLEIGTLTSIRPEQVELKMMAGATPPKQFVFWDDNFQLPIRVSTRQGVSQASVATLVDVNRTGVMLRSSVTVQPRYAPLFGLTVQLPRDWGITSITSAGKSLTWETVRAVADEPPDVTPRQTIQITLETPLNPEQSLELALTAEHHPPRWLEQEADYNRLPLPELRLVGVNEVEGTILIQAPPDIDLLVSDLASDLRSGRRRTIGRHTAQQAGTALQFQYQDDARVSGIIQARMKPAKVSAETLAFVRPDHAKLDVHYELDLHITQGTVRHIRFTLPAVAGNKIQVALIGSSARIIEQQIVASVPADEPHAAADVWQIVLDQPITGDLTLSVDFERAFTAPPPRDPSPPRRPT